MRQQYEFKKFPILATILAAVCLLLSVVGVTASLADYNYYYTGPMIAGLCLIIVAVLMIAGLTTGRPLLLKVISIIVFIAVMTTNFGITIGEFGEHRVALFGVALLMLIVSVLSFVYFVTVKTPRIRMLFLVASSILAGITLVYAITFTITDLTRTLGAYDVYEYPYYFILVGYAIVTSLPMVVYFSLSKKEEPQEEQAPAEEAPQEEEPKQVEEKPEEAK